jgi:site-specific DNA-cytosine methylase
MMKWAYYNDNDPFTCDWLHELIKDGLITDGEVDCRSIVDVSVTDIAPFIQCHFFAGIGGWPYALRLAGVPDDTHVWTASLPCQPFSAAGKMKGTDDHRHLFPEYHRLAMVGRPAIMFGEQVASPLGREWFARVRIDLEGMGYGVGAADLCAAGVGALHIRQRLFWTATRLADTDERQRGRFANGEGCEFDRQTSGRVESNRFIEPSGVNTYGLGDTNGSGLGKQCGSIAMDPQQQGVERGSGGVWRSCTCIACARTAHAMKDRLSSPRVF